MNIIYSKPITIVSQGSFFAGGTVAGNADKFDPYHATPETQTLHGDHAYAYYQIPDNARKYPMVFLHGHGQSARTWETTPDGREGFQNIFLRKGFSVCLVDQPRRGDAGRSIVSARIDALPDEQKIFNTFRIGMWPDYYENVSFSKEPAALEQFFRQCTPNTAPFDLDVVSDGVAAVFEEMGDSILVSHSQGGGVGWDVAIKSDKVKAIVAFEPGTNFPFMEKDIPEPMTTCDPKDVLIPRKVSDEDFLKLTRMPIVVFYGDNIPEDPCNDPGMDHWRVRKDMAKIWVDKINENGGDAELVSLPERGIFGNTHFPFSDTNNKEVAELVYEFLCIKDLK